MFTDGHNMVGFLYISAEFSFCQTRLDARSSVVRMIRPTIFQNIESHEQKGVRTT